MKKQVSNFSLPLKNLLKHRSLDNTTKVSYSVGLRCGPVTCISNKLSGDANTARLGPTLWEPVIDSKLNVEERGHCQGRLKAATEHLINQSRNCNSETRLQPLESQHEPLCVHPDYNKLPQQRAEGIFFYRVEHKNVSRHYVQKSTKYIIQTALATLLLCNHFTTSESTNLQYHPSWISSHTFFFIFCPSWNRGPSYYHYPYVLSTCHCSMKRMMGGVMCEKEGHGQREKGDVLMIRGREELEPLGKED